MEQAGAFTPDFFQPAKLYIQCKGDPRGTTIADQ
jgi:hypothetical protein